MLSPVIPSELWMFWVVDHEIAASGCEASGGWATAEDDLDETAGLVATTEEEAKVIAENLKDNRGPNITVQAVRVK